MAREPGVYRCQECGFASPKPGTCPDCRRATGQLVPLVEERVRATRGGRTATPSSSRPVALKEIASEPGDRLPTRIGELDRVLGGGLVKGSLVLIGGEPGAGKSTLLLQAARALTQVSPPVLYISAEESAAQVKLRADRLGVAGDGLLLWAENDLSLVISALGEIRPRALIVDSIQTVFLPEFESAPGSVAQVRECGGRLLSVAKGRGIATFIVGHVTKDGALAGPRVLEHLVDTVLYFEGERHHVLSHPAGAVEPLRVHRRGRGVPDGRGRPERGQEPVGLLPSGADPEMHRARSSWRAWRGPGPSYLELQALVAPASFGTPRRTVLGADYNRVCLLLAVAREAWRGAARQPGCLRERRGRWARDRTGRRSAVS